jgi:serine/threonine-protein kinase
MDDLIGQQLGSYHIVEKIGAGNMAVVYRASQVGTDRPVALKILPHHLMDDPVALGRFEREANVIAMLRHPNILTLYEFGEAGGHMFIAMPCLQHGTLAHRLQGVVPSIDDIRHAIWQLADALHHAHAAGVVHRDVKPSNVLLDPYGNCLLTDFGIAKLATSISQLSGTGVAVGTPTYMSPEQALAGEIDHRSDIYSLGVILYQMVAGQVPFSAKMPVATALMHINNPLPSPRQFNPALSPEIEEVIVKALAKKPADRYATASEMASALLDATLARG